jgi:hypothetical protein
VAALRVCVVVIKFQRINIDILRWQVYCTLNADGSQLLNDYFISWRGFTVLLPGPLSEVVALQARLGR